MTNEKGIAHKLKTKGIIQSLIIIRVLGHVMCIRHRILMPRLRYRRIWLSKAKLNEHVLVIALILFCRMHAATSTIRKVISILSIILYWCVATGYSVDVIMVAYCAIPH